MDRQSLDFSSRRTNSIHPQTAKILLSETQRRYSWLVITQEADDSTIPSSPWWRTADDLDAMRGCEGIRSFCWCDVIDANNAEKEITKCTKKGGEDGLHVVPWLHLVSKMLQVRLHLLRCLPMILKYYDFFASWYKEWCTHKYTSRETVKFDHTLPAGTIQYCYNNIDYLWRDEEEESSGHNNRPCEQLVMMAFHSRESTKRCFNSGALKVLLLRMPTTCTCTVHWTLLWKSYT